MTWVRVDDQYPDHPKIALVGPLGLALHMAAACYAARYLTDGFVPRAQIRKLINLDGIFRESNGVSNGVSNAVSNGVSHAVSHEEVTAELVAAGLFDVVDGGFRVHDYLDYNPNAQQVKAERKESADRQAAWRQKNKRNAVSNAVTNAVTNGLVTAAPYPYPFPIKKEEEEEEEEEDGQSNAVTNPLEAECAAIRGAYDAAGIMLSKTHMDAHLETISRVGLKYWLSGWQAAVEAGKHNKPAYVARCAESAKLEAEAPPRQKQPARNGRDPVPTTREELKAYYAPEKYEGIVLT